MSPEQSATSRSPLPLADELREGIIFSTNHPALLHDQDTLPCNFDVLSFFWLLFS